MAPPSPPICWSWARARAPRSLPPRDFATYLKFAARRVTTASRFIQPGQGGYGDPLEREPARVLADVQDDYVSVAAAERDYGVVLKAGLDAVDAAATSQLRAARRSAR